MNIKKWIANIWVGLVISFTVVGISWVMIFNEDGRIAILATAGIVSFFIITVWAFTEVFVGHD